MDQQMALLFTFNITKNLAGGDCLYRSIATYTKGDEDEHRVVRTEVCGYIGQNWKEYMMEIITQHREEVNYFSKMQDKMLEMSSEEIETSRQVYLKYMTTSGTYGTSTELIAAARLFKFNYTVIQELTSNTNNVFVKNTFIKQNYTWAYFLFTGNFRTGHWEMVTPTPDENIYLPDCFTYEGRKFPKQYILVQKEEISDKETQQSQGKRICSVSNKDVKRRKICLIDPKENPLWKDLGFESEKVIENYSYTKFKDGVSVTHLGTQGTIILKLNPGTQTPLITSKSNITFTICSGNHLFRGVLANKIMSYRGEINIRKGEAYILENLSTDQAVYLHCRFET